MPSCLKTTISGKKTKNKKTLWGKQGLILQPWLAWDSAIYLPLPLGCRGLYTITPGDLRNFDITLHSAQGYSNVRSAVWIGLGCGSVTYVCMWVEIKGQFWVSSVSPLYFLRSGLSLNLELSWVDWLASGSLGSACLHTLALDLPPCSHA